MRCDALIPTHPGLAEALGQSEAFLAFQEELSRVAKVDRPVLLVGERGTGKELAAARLHFLSRRWQGPFVILDGASLSPSLAEAELFGHEAGAFTGAAMRRPGRFERADGGTLFLDEAGNLPLSVQDKLLRVVEYGQYERVGGTQRLEADVRIVAATNADLPGLVRQGRFRADLLDRLAFCVLHLPPLRARGDDVLLLAEHFATRFAMEAGLPEPEFSTQARRALLTYAWPGNIRELRNTIERCVLKAEGGIITALDTTPFASPWQHGPAVHADATAVSTPAGGGATPGPASAPDIDPADTAMQHGDSGTATTTPTASSPNPQAWTQGTTLPDAVRHLEEDALRGALARTRHNRRAAAELLGLTYDQFRGLYRRHRDAIEKT
jgi:psp operon transcriptional activator